MFRPTFSALVCFFALAASAQAAVLRTAAEVNSLLETNGVKTTYDVTGIVLSTSTNASLILEDATGRMHAEGSKTSIKATPGDRIRLQGLATVCPTSEPWVQIDKITLINHGKLPPPVDIALSDLDGQRDNLRRIRVTGTVLDIRTDEIDPRYLIIFLKENETVMPAIGMIDRRSLPENIVNAKVRLTGLYERHTRGTRKFLGAVIAFSMPIEIVTPAPEDPFDVQPLEKLIYLTPKDVAALGRRRVCGEALAIWNGNRLIVRETSGRIVNVELSDASVRPLCGECGVFVGYPTTDLIRINLSRTLFRKDPAIATVEDIPEETTAQHLISYNMIENGILYHGRLLQLKGFVRSLPDAGSTERRMLLADGAHIVPVDLSSLPAETELPPLGSEITVTGRCLLELDNWRNENDFPRIRGFALITRKPDDIRVVRLPTWWTPRRMLAIIGILLAGLVGFFLWNLALRVLVRKRTRQALRAELDNARSELRVEERTNLAVELHDALSQNLTGIAFELKAAGLAFKRNRDDGFARLASAEKTLHSCRNELKNCLWDLRNDALGQGDMDEAIHRAVLPHLGTADLRIRLNVPRNRITDNTAHAILRIIRELVTNAIRHGGADKIRIAGSYDRGRISFSVRDNGSGFDPAQAPGMDEGHFGLHGIRERLAALNGSLEIESHAGQGTKATITLAVPDTETETDAS